MGHRESDTSGWWESRKEEDSRKNQPEYLYPSKDQLTRKVEVREVT